MVRRATCVLFAAVVALSTGCVERRFRVESNPPGAYVTVNNQPIGPAPVDVEFLYYGHYVIELKKEGFQTKRVRQHIKAPWYAYPPFDLIVENFIPIEINDMRVFGYELEPALVPNLDQFKAEGEEYRQRAANLPPPRYPDEPKRPQPIVVPKDAVLPPPKGEAPKPLGPPLP